ncbi:MAG: thiamine pyrophosphate-dependent dehydrogenase E1 component subunit alpha [Gammaproteobacteria bacterium]|nr:thiamine pyrophosphate-dependent dehydrogenase E1 component subunit alpha [Gammaproteobacteria bacterium]
MLRIRMIEEAVESRYHEDQMKTPIHLAIGQEAVSAGYSAALEPSDYVFCGHRTHACYLAKGGDLKAMFSEFFCRANGCAGSRGGSMHLLDKSVGMMGSSAIVAGAIPLATGSALSSYLKDEKRVTTVFLGDAAVEEGVMWESLNFALLKKLPIVYVCENNYYSVCSPIEYRQPPVEICKKAEGFGALSFSVDGNNVLEMYEIAQRAVAHAREKGPVFIEAHTYRWRGHHGSGDDSHTGYRDVQELALWQSQDPVLMMKQVMYSLGYLDEASERVMREKIELEIDAAFEHAIHSANPVKEDLCKFVYSEGDTHVVG